MLNLFKVIHTYRKYTLKYNIFRGKYCELHRDRLTDHRSTEDMHSNGHFCFIHHLEKDIGAGEFAHRSCCLCRVAAFDSQFSF